jgi:hypothetical protein
MDYRPALKEVNMGMLRIMGPAMAATVLLAACNDQSMPTKETPTSPNFANGNAAPQSGLHVLHVGVFLEVALIVDPNAGLAVALHSGSDGYPFCGESATVEHLLFGRFILSRTDPDRVPEPGDPTDGFLIQAILKSNEIFATVYSLEEFTDICDFLLNGTRVAEGTVRVVATDNDFLAFIRSVPIRADAFGFMAHGIVDLPSGGTARLNATYRAVFFPPDQVKETATVKLLPNR